MVYNVAIHGDRSLREELGRILPRDAFQLLAASEAGFGAPDLAIVENGAPDPFRIARDLRSGASSLPLMLIVARTSPDLALAASRAGFTEYLRRPFAGCDLVAAVERCLQTRTPKGAAEEPSRLLGESECMREVRARIRDIGAANCSVLVTGETGTGKELVAEMIHSRSARHGHPLVCLNCAAVPDGLWESELFGCEKGAFTGAQSRRLGVLEAAAGGTVFLDEIGEMSLQAQAKILRAIETRQIYRLGSSSPISVSVRIIAATNRDLEELVQSGHFRRDLYFRLSVARIHLPPLRERREDVPLLLKHYLSEFNSMFGRAVTGFTDETSRCLDTYDWPGNVRELRNVVEACFVHLPFAGMRLLELPEQYRRPLDSARESSSAELDRLRSTLDATNWNISKTAEQLRWSRMTLYRKLAKYNLGKQSKAAGEV